MNYTIWVSNKTGQYYLFEGEQKNPNYWFYNNNKKVNYKQLTIDQFNNLIAKYNLSDNWYPGDYDIFKTFDKLI